MENYILIVMDKTPNVHFMEKSTITEIYQLIVELKLTEGTYKIIKGNIVK
jgi:hypothetical protein